MSFSVFGSHQLKSCTQCKEINKRECNQLSNRLPAGNSDSATENNDGINCPDIDLINIIIFEYYKNKHQPSPSLPSMTTIVMIIIITLGSFKCVLKLRSLIHTFLGVRSKYTLDGCCTL